VFRSSSSASQSIFVSLEYYLSRHNGTKPLFVSAALETAVLLPKFIRACPNALLQRKLLPS
jgi:hypothetical protein